MRISGRPEEAGFTLIELLVVVAVIALLTAFALPRVIGALHDSRRVIGQGDLHTIETALERYRLDSPDGAYPHGATFSEADFRAALAQYLRPSSRSAATADLTNGYYDANFVPEDGRGYVYLSDAGGTFFILVDPGSAPIDPNPNTDTDTDLRITCGNGQETIPVTRDLVVRPIHAGPNPITQAEVEKGCSFVGATPKGAAIITN